jgi:hypothetical protein
MTQATDSTLGADAVAGGATSGVESSWEVERDELTADELGHNARGPSSTPSHLRQPEPSAARRSVALLTQAIRLAR